MNERCLRARGLYPGPRRQQRRNKTVYDRRKSLWDGNAVRQRRTPHRTDTAAPWNKDNTTTSKSLKAQGKSIKPAVLTGSLLWELLAPAYMSDGWRPVCLAMRDSIRGPISSLSWNANTKSGQPSRASVR